MSCDLGFIEQYAQLRRAELLNEAERDRLADLTHGPARPVRARVADWLYAAAERVEGASRQPVAPASAA